MKSLSKVFIVTTLLMGIGAAKADPVSELATIAAKQVAEQAAELKINLAEQLKQSLNESLAEAVSEDMATVAPEVVVGLANTDAVSVE